jgi:hypothetical protein
MDYAVKNQAEKYCANQITELISQYVTCFNLKSSVNPARYENSA